MNKHIQTVYGFTLIELLTVIAMIGILSAMGYAGLQGAIANSRVKDSAYNMTAYVETVANKARQLSDTLCIKKKGDTKLVTYQASCANAAASNAMDSLEMVTNMKISTKSISGFSGSNWASSGAEFVPRHGLSAAPYEGYFVAQYGSSEKFGAAVKIKTKNSVVPKKGDGTNFDDL